MKLVVLVALVAPLLSTVSAGVLSGSSKPDLGINIKFPEANPFSSMSPPRRSYSRHAARTGRGGLADATCPPSEVKNGDSSNLLLVRLANQAGEQLGTVPSPRAGSGSLILGLSDFERARTVLRAGG